VTDKEDETMKHFLFAFFLIPIEYITKDSCKLAKLTFSLGEMDWIEAYSHQISSSNLSDVQHLVYTDN